MMMMMMKRSSSRSLRKQQKERLLLPSQEESSSRSKNEPAAAVVIIVTTTTSSDPHSLDDNTSCSSGFEVILAPTDLRNSSASFCSAGCSEGDTTKNGTTTTPSSSSSCRSLANSIVSEESTWIVPTSLRIVRGSSKEPDLPEEKEEYDDEEEKNSSTTSTEQEHLVQFLIESMNELEKQETERHEQEQAGIGGGMMEALSMACLNTCGSGHPALASLQQQQQLHDSLGHPLYKTKSILRTKGDSRSPTEAGILSDRNVSFSQLEIHEFGMTLGDHPSAISGPPVALDYQSLRPEDHLQRIIDVDEYERARMPRRTRRHLKLTYQDKCATLQDKGFSLQELHEAWAEAIRIRKQRQETLKQTYAMMVWDDLWESTCRKYQRLAESLALA